MNLPSCVSFIDSSRRRSYQLVLIRVVALYVPLGRQTWQKAHAARATASGGAVPLSNGDRHTPSRREGAPARPCLAAALTADPPFMPLRWQLLCALLTTLPTSPAQPEPHQAVAIHPTQTHPHRHFDSTSARMAGWVALALTQARNLTTFSALEGALRPLEAPMVWAAPSSALQELQYCGTTKSRRTKPPNPPTGRAANPFHPTSGHAFSKHFPTLNAETTHALSPGAEVCRLGCLSNKTPPPLKLARPAI